MFQLEQKPSSPEIFPVLDLPVHLLEDYTGWLIERVRNQLGTHVVTLNAEMAILAEQEQNLAKIIRMADLVIPDGSGIVLYLLLRGKKQKRSPGIELAESLLNQLGEISQPPLVCFYGGSPRTAAKAKEVWQKKAPQLSIMSQHGYLDLEEQQQWQETLQKAQPKVIFVGLGVPRQEFWIHQYRFLCPNSIWVGVGGSFDIWSGNKVRAPLWLRNNNLEWSYRLYQEPWRWKRMLALPKFFWRSLLMNN